MFFFASEEEIRRFIRREVEWGVKRALWSRTYDSIKAGENVVWKDVRFNVTGIKNCESDSQVKTLTLRVGDQEIFLEICRYRPVDLELVGAA